MEDTEEWRMDTDLVSLFVRDNLVLDADAAVVSVDLIDEFNSWLSGMGQASWSSKTFVARLESAGLPGVYKQRTKELGCVVRRSSGFGPLEGKLNIWNGLRWADA